MELNNYEALGGEFKDSKTLAGSVKDFEALLGWFDGVDT